MEQYTLNSVEINLLSDIFVWLSKRESLIKKPNMYRDLFWRIQCYNTVTLVTPELDYIYKLLGIVLAFDCFDSNFLLDVRLFVHRLYHYV